MFLRIKKIKGKEYGYRVRNKWTGNGARQKVVGYLGRIYRLERKNETSFGDYLANAHGKSYEEYMKSNDFDAIIMELVKWELSKHGGIFRNDGKIDLGNVEVALKEMSVSSGGREIVLKMNDGYLCRHTLKNVFSVHLGEEEEPGLDFAHALVNAGLRVPKEIFIRLYESLS